VQPSLLSSLELQNDLHPSRLAGTMPRRKQGVCRKSTQLEGFEISEVIRTPTRSKIGSPKVPREEEARLQSRIEEA